MNKSSNEALFLRIAFLEMLESMDGIGRITAKRIVSHFPDWDTLFNMPYEQIAIRLKGTRELRAIIQSLKKDATIQPIWAKVQATVQDRMKKGIHTWLTDQDGIQEKWKGFQKLSPPNLLYGFGNEHLLRQPYVAFLGKPPLQPASFEFAETMIRTLANAQILMAGGLLNGFDTVLLKLTAAAHQPCLMWAGCGLGSVPNSIRSFAVASLRFGGLMVSSFPMAHGIFEYGAYERALLMTALSRAVIVVDMQPDSPEERAVRWAEEHQIPVWYIGSGAHPESQLLRHLSDLDNIKSLF